MDLKPQAVGIEPDSDSRSGGLGWRRLQVLVAIAALVTFVIPMVIDLSLEPFLLAMATPFAIGLLLAVKWPRVAAVWLGVVSLAVLLFSVPFLGEALTHPESSADFIPLSVFTLATVVGAAAAIPAFRESQGGNSQSRTPRKIVAALAGLIVAASAWSVVALVGLEDAVPKQGDILVTTEDLAFTPVEISTDRGTVSMAVTNRDNTRHTLTISELGVDLNLPPGTTQRVTFTAEPGTYTFFCQPHPTMWGELVAA